MFNRKALHIQGYNYKSNGYYFVTFCTENRLSLFGDIKNGIMHLNDAGRMVQAKIANTPHYYPDVSMDIFVVMPDHVHAVVVLDGEGRTQRSVPTDVGLSEVVKNIKTYTTTRYIQGVREHHWQPFNTRLWQRRYYERIIRNSNDLNTVREYIINNPMTWHLHQKSR
jgi:REP-associated tyrosine transposase